MQDEIARVASIAIKYRNNILITRLALGAAAATFQTSPALLASPQREKAPVAFARQAAIYLAHVGFGLPQARVAVAFARDRATIRHACALIETRRDSARLDRALDALEAALRRFAAALPDAFEATPALAAKHKGEVDHAHH